MHTDYTEEYTQIKQKNTNRLHRTILTDYTEEYTQITQNTHRSHRRYTQISREYTDYTRIHTDCTEEYTQITQKNTHR